MRIQTRLFLGTAALVLTLMAVQWWIYTRQLRSIEDDVTRVATTVGTHILSAEQAIFGDVRFGKAGNVWVDVDGAVQIEKEFEGTEEAENDTDCRAVIIPDPSQSNPVDYDGKRVVRRQFVRPMGESGTEKFDWVIETHDTDLSDGEVIGESAHRVAGVEVLPEHVRELVVKVEKGEKRHDRVLVVSEDNEAVHRIPIPVSPTVRRIQETMR